MHKVGDKVIIRKDLQDDNRYGDILFVDDMLKYCGMSSAVTSSRISSSKVEFVTLQIDNSRWNWSPEMFVPQNQVTPDSFFEAMMPDAHVIEITGNFNEIMSRLKVVLPKPGQHINVCVMLTEEIPSRKIEFIRIEPVVEEVPTRKLSLSLIGPVEEDGEDYDSWDDDEDEYEDSPDR